MQVPLALTVDGVVVTKFWLRCARCGVQVVVQHPELGEIPLSDDSDVRVLDYRPWWRKVGIEELIEMILFLAEAHGQAAELRAEDALG